MEQNIQRKEIIRILKEIKVPNLGKSIIELSWLTNFRIEKNDLHIDILIPVEFAESKDALTFAIIESIQEKFPNLQVHPNYVTSFIDKSKTMPSNPVGHITNIIAVGSGKGGVGKSTVSLNLALALADSGARVGLLDADLYGPSLPTMMGLQGQRPQVKSIDGKNKLIPIEKHNLQLMSLGLIVEPEQAVVLRGPRLAGIIKQFFNECAWPPLDYLIVDLPPGTGDIQLTLVQTVPLTGAVMVTTPQEVAVVDAVKAMNMFSLEQIQVPILGVVENMSWFTPEDMPDKKYFIFGEGGGKKLAKMGQTRLLGQLPLVQGVREGSDAGTPLVLKKDHLVRKHFIELAKNLAEQIVFRNQEMDPTNIVNIQ